MTAFTSARVIAGSGGAVGYNPEFRMLPSIALIPKAAWEEMLPGEPECWDFFRTVENVPPPGFTLSAIAAFEDRKILAAAPVFGIEYRLDTPFQGKTRAATDWLNKRWPRLITRSSARLAQAGKAEKGGAVTSPFAAQSGKPAGTGEVSAPA